MPAVAAPMSDPDDDAPLGTDTAPETVIPADDDIRLYLPDGEGWNAHIMQGTERQYCYAKAPGQDHFHLIVPGELFVQKGDEKLCLMCALRQGVLTTNRLFWQFPGRKNAPQL